MAVFGIALIASLLIPPAISNTPFAGPPTSNCNKTIDPTTDTIHGKLVNPFRSVLKLDCPECPVYNNSWHTNTTALIYDLTINNSITPPRVLLNGGPFLPAGPKLGWTPFTSHDVRPIPGNVPIDGYMAAPDNFSTTVLVAMQDTVSIPNDLGFDITRIFFLSFAFGNFENRWGNISYIDVYVMSTEENLLTIEWWEIVPMTEFFKNHTDTSEPPYRLPKKLAEKLKKRKDDSKTSQKELPLLRIISVIGGGIVLIGLVGLVGLSVGRRHYQAQRGRIYLEMNQDERVFS